MKSSQTNSNTIRKHTEGGSKDSSLGKIQRYCLSSQVKKAKALIELTLAKDINGKKKNYYRYIGD